MWQQILNERKESQRERERERRCLGCKEACRPLQAFCWGFSDSDTSPLHIYSAGDASVASMFPYVCGEAVWILSKPPPKHTHTQFLSFSDHITQAQEPAPKIHTSCALQVCSSTPACTVDNPTPLLILSSGRWESLCFGFPACPCLGAVLPEINMFILTAFWLCFNDLFETDSSRIFTWGVSGSWEF